MVPERQGLQVTPGPPCGLWAAGKHRAQASRIPSSLDSGDGQPEQGRSSRPRVPQVRRWCIEPGPFLHSSSEPGHYFQCWMGVPSGPRAFLGEGNLGSHKMRGTPVEGEWQSSKLNLHESYLGVWEKCRFSGKTCPHCVIL